MIPSTTILSQKYQMNLSNNTIFLFVVVAFLLPTSNGESSKLFREYIGADLEGIKFTDVPINPNVDFHFILSFTIDYTKTIYPVPTDGNFNVFWYTENLCPTDVSAIKTLHQNVKVAVSLGGDTVAKNQFAYFAPKSISSWVSNAVVSLTQITKMYNLDGIDIDYEHFSADPDTFAECIGQLITILKNDQIISFASIAPYANSTVQEHYQALWRKYGHVIDYVNFQFYAYDNVKTADKYIGYFQEQMLNYEGGQILASFATDGSGGLAPNKEFFAACGQLKKEGKLGGIFVWSADDSKKDEYSAEVKCQQLLASD